MSAVMVGRRAPPPYAAPLVILVIHGTVTWTLAREIVSAVTRNAAQPLEVSYRGLMKPLRASLIVSARNVGRTGMGVKGYWANLSRSTYNKHRFMHLNPIKQIFTV